MVNIDSIIINCLFLISISQFAESNIERDSNEEIVLKHIQSHVCMSTVDVSMHHLASLSCIELYSVNIIPTIVGDYHTFAV